MQFVQTRSENAEVQINILILCREALCEKGFYFSLKELLKDRNFVCQRVCAWIEQDDLNLCAISCTDLEVKEGEPDPQAAELKEKVQVCF